MGLILSAALLVLLVVLFIRDIRPNRAPLILALRIVMILLMALVLLGYIFRRTLRERPKVDLLVLVDNSLSMGTGSKLKDAGTSLAALPGRPGWRTALHGFGDTVVPLAGPGAISAEGSRTDVTEALKFAQATAPGAAVVVSDGEHNAAGDPVLTAQKLGFPVYTVGIGRKPARDLAIERIRNPNRAVVNDTVPIIVRVLSRGFNGDRARIQLTDNGQLVETRELTLDREESHQELEYRVVATPEGRHVYRVTADTLTGEDSYHNNQGQAALLVVPARLRVVYLTNRPGFNTRILLQLNRRNPDVEMVPVVALTGAAFQRVTETGMTSWSLGSLSEADVLLLDDIDEPAFGAAVSDAIRGFAADRGLLVLAGERFRAGIALSALLPLEPTGDRISKELPLQLTEEGRGNPVFFEGTRNLLGAIPPFWGASRSRGVKEGAVVWAKAADGTPLIAFRRNGPGKVVEVTGYPFWRAGFSAAEARSDGGDLYKFLTNAVRFLALKDVDRFRLSSDKLDYYAGEAISIMLQATSDDGKPWSGLDVRLTVGETLSMVDRGNGLYEAVVDGLPSGSYRAGIEAFAREQSIGRAQHDFTVSELSLELSQTGLNDDLLRRIARATGGEYVPGDSLGARKLEIRFAEYRRVFTFDPRLNRYLFLAIALLFILEVFLRKRRGML